MKLFLTNNITTWEISQLTSGKKWSGSLSAAPRSLTFNFIPGSGVEIKNGNWVMLTTEDGKELYRGIVISVGKNESEKQTIVTRDQMWYWIKNKDTFSFSNKRADEIFIDICNRFQIPFGSVANTSYVIPAQVNANNTLWDVITMALKTTKDQTRKKFYISDSCGKVHLLERASKIESWVLETGANISNYSFEESIDSTYTKVKLEASKDKVSVTATASDGTLINTYGLMQYFEKVTDSLSQEAANVRAKQKLAELTEVKKTFSITALGIPDVVAGTALYVKVPKLKIQQVFDVLEDSHTFDDNVHKMSLKLQASSEVQEVK